VAWAEAYLRTKWYLDPSSRLATIDWGREVGAAVTLFLGGAGFPSNTVSPGSRPTSIPSGILTHQPFGHSRHGPKIWGVPFCGGGAGFPSNTVYPGSSRPTPPKFHLDAPNRLATIHQRRRQDRQNYPIGYGEPFLPRDAMLARY